MQYHGGVKYNYWSPSTQCQLVIEATMRARQRWSKNNALAELCRGEIFDKTFDHIDSNDDEDDHEDVDNDVDDDDQGNNDYNMCEIKTKALAELLQR